MIHPRICYLRRCTIPYRHYSPHNPHISPLAGTGPLGGVSWSGPDPGRHFFATGSHERVLAVTIVSTQFCGGARRRDCTYRLASTESGRLLRYDGDTWLDINMDATGLNRTGARTAIRALASVPSGVLRLVHPPPNATLRRARTGDLIYEAPLTLVAANWRLSSEDVYEFDFSTVDATDEYVVQVPGVGRSDAFWISPGAFDFAAFTTGRGLFYQRCGFSAGLVPPHATERHARPPCHEHEHSRGHDHHHGEDATPSAADTAGVDAIFSADIKQSPLYAGEDNSSPNATAKDMSGGWHDAGDYNKYIMTAAEAIKDLVDGYDIDPSKFPDDVWNLPESGNGVPDLLDEMRWELDWMVRMQDTTDGGVYHKLSSCHWFFGMPNLEAAPRLINPKSTHDTAYFAAAVASASRIFRNHDAAASAKYLSAAEGAWSFLASHPGNALGEGVPAKGYGNPPGCHTGAYQDTFDYDNRLWAAAELFRATHNQTYGAFVEAWHDGEGPRVLSSNSGAGTRYAVKDTGNVISHADTCTATRAQ